MPFSFPSSPVAGQQSTQNGRVYQWSGSAWQLVTMLPAHSHPLPAHTHTASDIDWVAIQPWAANTAYAKGDLVSNAGIAYRRSAAGTSGATFNVANWQQITPSEFVGSQITSGTLANARLTTRARAAINTYLWSAFR